MSFLDKLFGNTSTRRFKELEPIVAQMGALEGAMKALSAEELRGETNKLKKLLEEGKTLEDILPEAFALVREASRRTLGERHFDVQVIGGIVLHQRGIAEMRTGEGKTLVATLPAYLNALGGKGVHIVTVNDYLSRRDATWMGQIYNALGLSVGVINHESSYLYDESHVTEEEDKERDSEGSFKIVYEYLRPCNRGEAYRADITYGTNNEFGFDYLRDNLAYRPDSVVQREHNYAIVDEVDSILIDEARTPLIISGPVAESESLYGTFTGIANKLEEGTDYSKDEKQRAITLSDAGIEKAEKLLGVDNIYTDKGIKYVHHLETAIRAKALFIKEKDYVVKDGEIVIVDSFTGRLQPGRRWSEGLHQAIESKEGVRVQQESRTYASITFQNYFRLYKKVAGMTGTATTSAEEFAKVYDLDVVSIPTNKPSRRVDRNDLVYQTEHGKMKAVAREVKELNKRGQPVLIGTVSIEKNEKLAGYLTQEGVRHNVLNAKNHEKEGEIIAEAGKKGTVTVATNMAGRGVDIKLGGPHASKEEADEVKELGGLFVLGTERHEARRIDNQLRGRAGRQGDMGMTQFFVSLEDDLMRVFGSGRIKGMMGKFGIPEDEPIESRLVSKSIEGAQEKIEGLHFDSRKHVLEYDDVLNFQRKLIYSRRRTALMGKEEEVEKYLKELVTSSAELENIIEVKRKELGGTFLSSVRQLLLQVIDMLWLEHLEAMDYLRSSVRLRAYGQRDPLIEYKREGLGMFKTLEANLVANIIHLLPNVGGIRMNTEEKNLQEIHSGADIISRPNSSFAMASQDKQNTPLSRPAAKWSEVGRPTTANAMAGRNDPCPCGSDKKYKKCGMVGAPEHKG